MNLNKLTSILHDARVDYITSGKNIKSGNINIKCPFCKDDPSEHLGINYEEDFWFCWRDSSHKGKSLSYLFRQLLKDRYRDYDERIKELERNIKPKEDHWTSAHNDFCTVEDPLVEITDTSKHFQYLKEKRGFGEFTKRVIQLFKLKRPSYGKHLYSIFIPYYEHSKMVTFSYRTIGKSSLRYFVLDKDKSIYSSQETLFGFDSATGGNRLYIVEGTMDAMKLSVLGENYGIHAVALSGKNVTNRQLLLLKELSSLYNNVYLLLDNDTQLERLTIYSKITKYIPALLSSLPDSIKDPGEFTNELFNQWRTK